MMLRDYTWQAAGAVLAIALYALPAGAADDSPTVPSNSSEQIRKAQTELRRLDCLKDRVDGKLGDRTRQAVKKFWASAKQPAADVNITDELIADLAERGAGYCRPARKFFAMGVRPKGNSTQPAMIPRGGRPGGVPGAAAQPLNPPQ